MHKRALSSMRSAVAQSVEEHMVMMRRQEEIHALGTNNKAHAIELQLAKLRRENEDLAHRLAKVQQTETEITATNIPSRRSHVKASRDRKRFLDTARRAAQARLERENAQILSRLSTYQRACTPGVDEVHAMGGAPRPMSKEEHRAQHAQDRADWSTIRSNEDRGQLCHQLVRIPHVRPGQQPTLLEALLIGFKHPKEADQLLFEVTAGPVTRYAKVSYEAMRLALEDAAVHDQRVVQRGVTLAEAAAAHLRFFGDGATLMLIWQQQGHVLQ
ncbi:Hypothetical Protein FCC1311_096182 [Hondaea fermentalgiana]|uniref:Uncharacterized protein n=1 Tax=Hondaea fermentalgiana TaxID=2315210 RepID=A0A2R5GS20_9STRA|nr:Hypothetical Protein FCC1311_096182 [Hondaea fermentalgiana]|eukprot:GBG33395.1 Hypothetical Protein FCC1311_096182 [Hondaea fermentalgiana]